MARKVRAAHRGTDQEKGSLQRAYQAARNPDTVTRNLQRHGIRDVPTYLKINIWWAEEWMRADSPFKLKVLDDDEHRRHLEILDTSPKAPSSHA